MSIQSIIRACLAVSGLSLALAGMGCAEDPAADGERDTGSVEAAPPAEADEGASGNEGEAGDAEPGDTDKD